MVEVNKFRTWVSLSRKVAKNFRRSLEELADALASRSNPSLGRAPVPVPVPVRNNPSNPFLREARRNFSTYNPRKSTFNYIKSGYRANPVNLSHKLWPYSAFRFTGGSSVLMKGIFPGTLYKNFTNTNARYFSSYSTSHLSRDAVQNLTSSLRAFFYNVNSNGFQVNSTLKSKSYHGNANLALENVQNAFELANKAHHSDNDNNSIDPLFKNLNPVLGSFVDFKIESPRLSIPKMSFIDEEILDTITSDFHNYQQEMNVVLNDIKTIFTNYGSLPMSIETSPSSGGDEEKPNSYLKNTYNSYSDNYNNSNSKSFRLHFPNYDVGKVEQLLTEIGVTRGIVYEDNSPSNPNVDVGVSNNLMERQPSSLIPNHNSNGANSSIAESSRYFVDSNSHFDEQLNASSFAPMNIVSLQEVQNDTLNQTEPEPLISDNGSSSVSSVSNDEFYRVLSFTNNSPSLRDNFSLVLPLSDELVI
ncbi:Spg5p ASCRUDRAFT_9984 [Ascoidea rubescens DSM 1968]|uniref:Uncharacterized protein n=1 Tax=Ascoidea rubescens DSM 1968 TaxID=1344418 RepID=A0A1D2VAJ2_9ASCO|nr:hypothetical protein ASCRUDRAFT_9984 [Ascoidea rubescens DSM 1968]ODV58630.1 hypothetical protein ASCRUDRAFT_9984 [Ascoidea rubescens DSM 1968]